MAVSTLKKPKTKLLAESEKETARVDFKSEFDSDSKKDWCEVLKDIAAMANSGGGLIVFGVTDGGEPSGIDVSALNRLDPAKVTDKIASYTDVQFADLSIEIVERSGQQYPAIVIGRAKSPLVFSKPGTYQMPGDKGRQCNAFSQGTIYVRHGAKSEPATSDDVRQIIDRRIGQVARQWRKGIRKVVTAPAGDEVHVGPPHMKLVPEDGAQQVRLVNDALAPAARFLNPDATHPYRQKELIPEIVKRLGRKIRITPHDILCVRRTHKADQDPAYTYVPKFGSPQYSATFADWIVERFQADPEFFTKACAEHSKLRKSARVNKPR